MDANPRQWGDYFLIRPLGGGGMGDVYLALYGRPGFERLCVVKRLIPETRANPERAARFRREAEIVKTLSHGAIARTLAIDEFEGEPFIAQEFLEGKTLTQLISASRGAQVAPLPIDLAVHIVREVARALAFAHAAGVVHRDVAPDNVMVTFAGEVRLIDFGVARSITDASLTAPGLIVGRWSYSAPEVLAGGRADQRADVYAAGVVLWELLTGHTPAFPQREAPPPPSQLRSVISPRLDSLVLRALAADPETRFSSAEELERSLASFLPTSFSGEVTLRAFVARCYDVRLLRNRLLDEIREMKAFRAARASSSATRTLRWWITYGPIAIGLLSTAGLFSIYMLMPPQKPSQLQPNTTVAAFLGGPSARPPSDPRPPESFAAHTPPTFRLSMPSSSGSVGQIAPPVPTGPLLDRARDGLRAGDLTGAERDAREALERGSTTTQKADAHLLLGKILLHRGQIAAASNQFTIALQLDPTNDLASRELHRLQRKAR